MRIVFMGSPDFAIPSLVSVGWDHDVVAVYCQPAKPAGRGNEIRKCAVHDLADKLVIPVRTPAKLRNNEEEFEHLSSLNLDAIVVAAYGIILPKNILELPRLGCFNIHASLLPRWRGASPIQSAILHGDDTTGITIMKMDEGLDTGPILLQKKIHIANDMTTGILHDKLAELGANLILPALISDFEPEPQLVDQIYNMRADERYTTYAPKLTKNDGKIYWGSDAVYIERQMRAFDPWPGIFTTLNGNVLKVLSATVEKRNGKPGIVLDDKLLVACGHRALRLTKVQLAGKKTMDADDFLRGTKVSTGTILGY